MASEGSGEEKLRELYLGDGFRVYGFDEEGSVVLRWKPRNEGNLTSTDVDSFKLVVEEAASNVPDGTRIMVFPMDQLGDLRPYDAEAPTGLAIRLFEAGQEIASRHGLTLATCDVPEGVRVELGTRYARSITNELDQAVPGHDKTLADVVGVR